MTLLDPVPLAWASWAGLAVGVVGTLVSVVGLTLTFHEARRARQAAQAAQSEVEKVVALSRSRTRLSALSSAVSQADAIITRIELDALYGSRELFTAFRRGVKEAIASMAILDRTASTLRLDEIDLALEARASLIDADVEQKAKIAKMRVAFHPIVNFLIHQEALAKTEDLS